MKPLEPSLLTRRIGIAAWSIVGVFAVLAIAVWLVIQAKIIVIPVMFAFGIVYLLNPFVTGLQRLKIGRILGAAIAYLVVLVLFVGVGSVVAPMLAAQSTELVEQVPLIYESATGWIADTAESLGMAEVNLLSFDDLLALVTEPGFVLSEGVQDFAGTAFGLAIGVLGALALVFLSPVIAFYILVDLPRLRDVAGRLLPPKVREETLHVAERLGRALGGFIRGQLLAATVVALLSIIGYRIVGLELWLVVGIIAGVLNMIPLVGPWIGGATAIGAALVSGNFGLVVAVGVVALVVQQIDNQIVSPLVLRATVKLHPSLIILALMVGGSVAGLLGVLLAVPLTAVTKVIASHLWRTRMLGEPWREAVEAIIEEPEITRTGEILVERIRARREQAEKEHTAKSEPRSFFDE